MAEKKKPGRPPAKAKPLPPAKVNISLQAQGRGEVEWDGKEVRVPAPGSWISFHGFGGMPIDEVVIPPEAVKKLCANTGHATPPTEVAAG